MGTGNYTTVIYSALLLLLLLLLLLWYGLKKISKKSVQPKMVFFEVVTFLYAT
jgi:flagellar biogenesis protein FliO